MFGCQDISVMIVKRKRNWLCQTALFGLHVKSMRQGIYQNFGNMDSWHSQLVLYVCIACV